MTDRLTRIFEQIPECDTFADIGCDHGYIAREMLDKNKCKKAIISDVSAKCLSKAKALLEDYAVEGRAIAVVSDGFKNTPPCDVALIAGMGGMEIISILTSASELPSVLILQPMKNSPEVRRASLQLGYKFNLDYTFYSDRKFYDLMVLTRGEQSLTKEQLEFGVTNLQNKGQDFLLYVNTQIKKLTAVAKKDDLKEHKREQILSKIERLKKICLK